MNAVARTHTRAQTHTHTHTHTHTYTHTNTHTHGTECIQEDDGEDFLDIIDNFDGMSEGDEDVSFVSMGGENEEDDTFDMIVGALEDIMMDKEFQDLQSDFAAQHCAHFEATDENKLIYTEIFSKYTELIEGYLERRLQQDIASFSMPQFMEMLMYVTACTHALLCKRACRMHSP